MVTTDICPPVNFDIQKRSLLFLVDDDVVNLIDNIPINIQLSLWISLWGKTVPPIMHLLLRQNSTSLSPLSLMVPQPCRPTASSLP